MSVSPAGYGARNVVVCATGSIEYRPRTSGAAATLSYEWPIWAFLSGTAHGALGNAWGPGLRGFDPELLRLSSGIGIRTRSSPDHQFEVLAGFGTEPIGRNFEVSQFRLVFEGTNERAMLRKLAPHLVRPLLFALPVYETDRHPLWKIQVGMWMLTGTA